MASDDISPPKYPSRCWPGEDLDGWTEVPLAGGPFRAFWDTDILDSQGVNPSSIIQVTDDFQVRFRVELVGELWRCMTGSWCFDLDFTAIGQDADFHLSEKLLPGTLEIKDWKGCEARKEDGSTCIQHLVTVPAGSVPGGDQCCSVVYETCARFCLRCCDGHIALVGFEAQEEYQFYTP